MHASLLQELSLITEEEQEILGGHPQINRRLYYAAATSANQKDVVDASLVLQNGKLIDIRKHVRFVHFPPHTHNYVEFVYMCQGSTTHIIDGQTITLRAGDFLFLNQHATQEILPAGEGDIAINFMILPSFFDNIFQLLGNEDSALRTFLISCLTDADMGGNYLYFDVADLPEVQNLAENLILTMRSNAPNKRALSSTTMGLLFLHLTNAAEHIEVSHASYEQDMMIRVLAYIEGQYKNAALTDFARENGIDLYTLSRLVKRSTGKTFLELLQEKRLQEACFLLQNTGASAAEIAVSVGYENTSFFHRLFKRTYGVTPRQYRMRTDL